MPKTKKKESAAIGVSFPQGPRNIASVGMIARETPPSPPFTCST